jgi:choline-sulfatase
MSPFEQSSRVPLIVHGPGRFASRRVGEPVSLVDLVPTLLELADADPGEGELSGRSLVALAGGAQDDDGTDARAGHRDVVIEYLAEGLAAPQLTLVRGRYKIVVCPGDPDQLFDVEDDPDELHDRAQDPALAGLLEQLRAELAARYDVTALGRAVRSSQRARRLVRSALATGEERHWDHEPTDPTAYVRGDFWSALERGRISARAEVQGEAGGTR